MGVRCNLFKYIFLLTTLIFLLTSSVSAGCWNTGPQCDDVSGRGYLKILTFNILFFSESDDVRTRLEPLVTFLNEQEPPVDVIFLQEVVGGSLALSEFTNSAKILKGMLSDEYNLKTAFEVGIPGVFYTGNAILSRCEINFSMAKRLPRESEVEILGQVIKLPRNVQLARLKIPVFAKVNAYNTHLCAGCSADERGDQLDELFNFMHTVENFIPGENPILLAGDFNIDRLTSDVESPSYGNLYNWIIGEGFVDAYAEYIINSDSETLDDLCDVLDVHCTYGAAYPYFTGDAGRIDYIFKKLFSDTKDARVIFNSEVGAISAPVSDHSGVLVEIWLETPPG